MFLWKIEKIYFIIIKSTIIISRAWVGFHKFYRREQCVVFREYLFVRGTQNWAGKYKNWYCL